MRDPKSPKISIVTISYNQADYLKDAIRSVLEQDYDNKEYIVIDGDSDDRSSEIISSYADEIDYWCSEPDDGPPQALNKGLAKATGDIFGFINSDDFLLPGALSSVAKRWVEASPRPDVVYGHGYRADEAGNLIRPIYSFEWDLERFLLGACSIVQQSTFSRLSLVKEIGGFSEENRRSWDGELWVELSKLGANWSRVDQHLSAFRLHEESITGSEPTYEKNDDESVYEKEMKALCERELGVKKITSLQKFRAKLLSWYSEPNYRIKNALWKLSEEVFGQAVSPPSGDTD